MLKKLIRPFLHHYSSGAHTAIFNMSSAKIIWVSKKEA